MYSIENQIIDKIKQISASKIIFPKDFEKMGSSEAVRLALHRIEKQGLIVRIAKGIYTRPKIHKILGAILPTTEEIAIAIAKRDKIRYVATGAYAQNALGLSTQVPMKIVLLTDGSPRIVKVGKRTIQFVKTSPKNLLAKGKISRLVIQALKDIGNGKLTKEEEQRIVNLLTKENPEILRHDIKLAPEWIKKIMTKALKNETSKI